VSDRSVHNDRSAVSHQGQRFLHGKECAAGVQGKEVVELLFCDLPQGRATAMTSAGKHHIDIAFLPLDRLIEPVKISQLRRISLHSSHIPSNRFDRIIQILWPPARDEHVRSLFDKQLCRRQRHSGSCSGDHRRFTVQLAHD
jgi:hypothetical protein